jgi:hypothetical protein
MALIPFSGFHLVRLFCEAANSTNEIQFITVLLRSASAPTTEKGLYCIGSALFSSFVCLPDICLKNNELRALIQLLSWLASFSCHGSYIRVA